MKYYSRTSIQDIQLYHKYHLMSAMHLVFTEALPLRNLFSWIQTQKCIQNLEPCAMVDKAFGCRLTTFAFITFPTMRLIRELKEAKGF